MTYDRSDSELTDSAARTDEIRVIVVDDDETWARTTGRLLESQDERLSVETATSLRDGERIFERREPDCLVCDYQLEDGTGLDLLATVRTEDEDRPFFLVTGEGNEDVASEALRRGATDYVQKSRYSGDPEGLGRRVISEVESYRTRRLLRRERRGKRAMLDIVRTTASRETLCLAFCDHLVDVHEYAGAWIGIDEGGPRLVPVATVGCEGYLDRIRGGESADRPSLTAREERTVHVVDPIEPPAAEPDQGDPAADWRGVADEYGFGTAAAIPIGGDQRPAGVLTVFGSDPGTFDARARRLLTDYAGMLEYALRTEHLKRSLVSTTSLSLEFRIDSGALPIVEFARKLPEVASVAVDSTAARNDDSLLYVVRISGITADDIPSPSAFDRIRAIDVDSGTDPLRCDLVVNGPTPEDLLAERGAKIVGTTVEDGSAIVSVTYPGDGDLGSLMAALHDRYPGADLVRIRSGVGDREPDDGSADLTDKQRGALEVAYYHGYFEQPRRRNASEIADRLDISRVTFTQHLRAAEQKVIAGFLDDT